MKIATSLAVIGLFAIASPVAAQKVTLASLPPAVQATVKEETKNATVLNIAKETEKGKTVYEVESKVSGKTRDFMVDGAGKVLSVEEEMDLAAVPAAVKVTIEKQSAGGAVRRIEKLIEGATVQYEVQITKKGKTSEITVNGDGSIRKG